MAERNASEQYASYLADGWWAEEQWELGWAKAHLANLVFPEWWKSIKALHNEESMKQQYFWLVFYLAFSVFLDFSRTFLSTTSGFLSCTKEWVLFFWKAGNTTYCTWITDLSKAANSWHTKICQVSHKTQSAVSFACS